MLSMKASRCGYTQKWVIELFGRSKDVQISALRLKHYTWLTVPLCRALVQAAESTRWSAKPAQRSDFGEHIQEQFSRDSVPPL